MTPVKRDRGVTPIRPGIDNNSNDAPSFSGGGGNSGGGMLDQLERRVERLEGDTLIIKDKLTVLSVRSESFVTKSDLAELKGELRFDLAQVRGDLRADLGELKSELKSDMSSLETRIMVNMMQAISNSQNAIMDKMDKRCDRITEDVNRRFDRVDDNTKWKWSAIIIPVGSVIVTAAVAFLIAKYVSH